MTYVDFKVYRNHRSESAACLFRTSSGHIKDVSLREAASYFTDLWVGIAFALELTVPVFILLFALARTGLYFASVHRNEKGVPR
jgi:hypothetical protein